MTILEPTPIWWRCPECRTIDQSRALNQTVFHACPAHHTAAVPLVQVPNPDAEPDVKRVPAHSEDYSYGEREGETGLHTYHADGRVDAHVFAPTATSHAQGGPFPTESRTRYWWTHKG